MKKKADGPDGVYIYHQGEKDAYSNTGCKAGDYAGRLRKCYMNGYKFGQSRRAAEKNRGSSK